MNTHGRIDLIAGCIAVRHPTTHPEDGPDYQRYCTEHRWASIPSPSPDGLGCPYCRVALEETKGRERFDALQRDMLAQQVEKVPHG
jgi:hypothetical protein